MMNDNEVIKVLERRASFGCDLCSCNDENCEGDECDKVISQNILDLIKRQKAEIEKLKVENDHHRKTIAENAQKALEVTLEEIEKARAEAIKEFATKIQKELEYNIDNEGNINSCFVPYIISEVVEEITEKGGAK